MQLLHLLSDADFPSSHQPLSNICVQLFYLFVSCFAAKMILCITRFGVFTLGTSWPKLFLSSEGPESHKVSVVLLKCCSILFICKCCNLSVNVVNTNEQRRGGKPPTFLLGQKRAPEPCHGRRKLRTLLLAARVHCIESERERESEREPVDVH